MRFMVMHRTNAANEAGERPSDALIAEVGRMVGELRAAGTFRDGAGLRASALGARVVLAGGRRTVERGPYLGRNELPAALCVVRVRSLEEAVDWAARLGGCLGDAELEVRPLTEPWDLGFGEKPAGDPTTRYMAVLKADPRTEEGAPPAPEARAALAAVLGEARQAGVLLSGEVLRPSSHARRIVRRGGKQLVLDGPFAETKELIAGYLTLEAPAIEDVLPFALRYAVCLEDAELDVRPLYEPGER